MSDWYDVTGAPSTGSQGSSATIRGEFAAISAAMAKLPTITGNGGKILAVNTGGTAIEALASGLTVAQGGTGTTTLTDGGILLGSGTGAITATARPTTGQVLVGQATGDPALESGDTLRSSLGLAIGTNVQAYSANLTAIAALAVTDGNFIVGNGTTWVAESAATARTSLGLGSLATASTISNTNWSGTDLSLANGGTGASLTDPNADRILFWDDSAGAMTWLTVGSGLQVTATTLESTAGGGTVTSVSGAGTVNGLTLTGTVTTAGSLTLGGTLAINDAAWSGTDLAVANGGTGASTAATARSNLGLAIGTNVQAYSATLTAIAALAVTDGNIIVGNGTTWVAESGATARTSLGLGSLATASTISNTNWSGTDLAVVNGGTGASTAADARTNLGLGSIATSALTVSTADASGTPAANDIWLKYTA